MTITRGYILVLWGATLFALSVPGQLFENGSIALGMIALVPYFFALFSAPDRRTAARYGFLFGVMSAIVTYYWLVFYRDFAVWAVGGVTLAHGGGHAILAMGMFRMRRYRRAWRPFIAAMAWATIEYMKSIGFIAFPWGTSALAASESLVFIQHIELTGPWTLSYVVALVNAIIAELLLMRDQIDVTDSGRKRFYLLWRQTAVALTMITIAILFGIQRMNDRLPIIEKIPLLIVQQNTDAWHEGAEAAAAANIALSRAGLSAVEAEASNRKPEMIIWSETSIGFSYKENKEHYQQWPPDDPLLPFILQSGTPLLSGIPYIEEDDAGDRQVYNAALLIDQNGQARDYYGKRHLVPFAEHIPFWKYKFMRFVYRNIIGLSATWSKGTREPIISLSRADGTELRFGVLICFEDSFAYLARDIARNGGQLMINLTNNAWSQRRSAQVQHLSAARLRTIETRRALVRSTNSGESVLINAYGEIEARLPSFEKAYLHIEAPIYDAGLTFYARTGDWLGQIEMWGAMALWIFCFIGARGRRDYSLFFVSERSLSIL